MGKTLSHGGQLSRDVFAGQIIGARNSQQDTYAEPLNFSFGHRQAVLYVVSDGMGGHAGGELASQTVIAAFTDVFARGGDSLETLFDDALTAANSQVAAEGQRDAALDGMGATVVAIVIVDDELYLFSVGDSPLWLIRESEMSRLNEDHSMLPVLMKMADMGEISAEDALNDPKRHVLRSVIHGKEIKLKNRTSEPLVLQRGDSLVLGSDGIESLSESKLIALTENRPRYCAKAAVESVLDEIERLALPNQDNATLVVVHIGKGRKTSVIKHETEVQSAPPNKNLLIAGIAVLALLIVLAIAIFTRSDKKNEVLNNDDPAEVGVQVLPAEGAGSSENTQSSSRPTRRDPNVLSSPLEGNAGIDAGIDSSGDKPRVKPSIPIKNSSLSSDDAMTSDSESGSVELDEGEKEVHPRRAAQNEELLDNTENERDIMDDSVDVSPEVKKESEGKPVKSSDGNLPPS